jgi:hypothetical protein
MVANISPIGKPEKCIQSDVQAVGEYFYVSPYSIQDTKINSY